MEFIVLRTSLVYVCMGLCCEMLNLVVLWQILWFRCWFSVMKIGRGKPFFGKKLLPPSWFTSPHRILGQSFSMNFTCKMWMENEILLYPNKKGLEGVIALTRMQPLIAQALNRTPAKRAPLAAGQAEHASSPRATSLILPRLPSLNPRVCRQHVLPRADMHFRTEKMTKI